MDFSVIIDVSPLALMFYSLTLIGTTFHDHFSKGSTHKKMFVSLWAVTIVSALYVGYIVVWKLKKIDYNLGNVYTVTTILLLASSWFVPRVFS